MMQLTKHSSMLIIHGELLVIDKRLNKNREGFLIKISVNLQVFFSALLKIIFMKYFAF